MANAPFSIFIRGRNYECRVLGQTEGEAADEAETVLHQLRLKSRTFPAQVQIACRDPRAAERLAAYFADITVEPDLNQADRWTAGQR